MIGAAAPVTLSPHPGNIGAPIALLLLTLTAGIHLHGIWILGGCLLHRVMCTPFLLCLVLSHVLVENLGSCLQIVEICNRTIGNGQVVLELFIEPVVEPGTVVSI